MECAQLRIKDVDFQRREITVRQGKGGKDRGTMLPLVLVQPLREQTVQAKQFYEDDRLHRRNGVMVPNAWSANIPPQRRNGDGSGSFHRTMNRPIPVAK